jgi:Ala-tRNA(Pro) deacylase
MTDTPLFKKVMEILNGQKYPYEMTNHRPMLTSKQASEISGHDPALGTKSLALCGGSGKIIVATTAGNERLDFKAIKRLSGESRVELCPEEQIIGRLGTHIGGIAPFGYTDDIVLMVSKAILEAKQVYFNPGRNDVTICISNKVFRKIMERQNARII